MTVDLDFDNKWSYDEKQRAIKAIGDRERKVKELLKKQTAELKSREEKFAEETKLLRQNIEWSSKELKQLESAWCALVNFQTFDQDLDF